MSAAPRRPRRLAGATTHRATVRPARPRCPGCGAAVGEQHDRVCDVARCRATGLQWMACDLTEPVPVARETAAAPRVAHEPDTWTGRWPGEQDCERLGFLARFVPGRGWVPCAPDDSGAQPDFERLRAEASWDPRLGRWTARGRWTA